jgi:hypothetical protein
MPGPFDDIVGAPQPSGKSNPFADIVEGSSVDFAKQGLTRKGLIGSASGQVANAVYDADIQPLYPGGMKDASTQDIQNIAASPHRPVPTMAVQAEQVAPDLVSAFENAPKDKLGTATSGYLNEAVNVKSTEKMGDYLKPGPSTLTQRATTAVATSIRNIINSTGKLGLGVIGAVAPSLLGGDDEIAQTYQEGLKLDQQFDAETHGITPANSIADHFVDIAGNIAPYIALGPMASAGMVSHGIVAGGEQSLNQGQDATTAAVKGTIGGIASYMLTKIPMTAKGIAAAPLVGIGERWESNHFSPDDQKQQVLDPKAIATDYGTFLAFNLVHNSGLLRPAYEAANGATVGIKASGQDYEGLRQAYMFARGVQDGTPEADIAEAFLSRGIANSGGMSKAEVRQAVDQLRRVGADRVLAEGEPAEPTPSGPESQIGATTTEPVTTAPEAPAVTPDASAPEVNQTPAPGLTVDKVSAIRAKLEAMRKPAEHIPDIGIGNPDITVDDAIKAASAEVDSATVPDNIDYDTGLPVAQTAAIPPASPMAAPTVDTAIQSANELAGTPETSLPVPVEDSANPPAGVYPPASLPGVTPSDVPSVQPATVPEPVPVKQPWEMTHQEYWNTKHTGNNGDDVTRGHYKAVKAAVGAGKPVPAEVLADYPDLKPVSPMAHKAQALGNEAQPLDHGVLNLPLGSRARGGSIDIPVDHNGNADVQAFADMVKSHATGTPAVHPDDVEAMLDKFPELEQTDIEGDLQAIDNEADNFSEHELEPLTQEALDEAFNRIDDPFAEHGGEVAPRQANDVPTGDEKQVQVAGDGKHSIESNGATGTERTARTVEQPSLLTGQRKFGVTAEKKGGQSVGTSDFMDGFTHDWTPDLFAEEPAHNYSPTLTLPENAAIVEQAKSNAKEQLSFDFREGTSDVQKIRTQKLVRDLVRGRQGVRPSLLGNAINTAFVKKGVFNFVGQKITSPLDLASLAQVYRNPSFETLRYFFVKDGVIVGQTGVSSRLPSVSYAFPGASGYAEESGLPWLKDQMAAVDADGYWLLHNHPSGNVSESHADISLTQRISEEVPGFKGHVIINHNKYGILTQEAGNPEWVKEIKGKTEYHVFDMAPDDMHTASVDNPYLGRVVQKPDDIVSIGKEMQQPGHTLLIVQGGRGAGIRGIMDIPPGLSQTRLAAITRKLALDSGGGQVFAVLPDSTSEYNLFAQRGIREGYLLDAVDPSGKSMRTMGITPSKNKYFGKPISGQVVMEDTPDYNPGNFVSNTTRSFIDKDVKRIVGDGGKGFVESLQMIRHALTPTSGVKAKYLDAVMRMKGDQDKTEYMREVVGKEIKDMFEKMPQSGQVAFIDKVKTGHPQSTPELQAIADMMRDIDTATWNEAKEFKPTLAWKENHYRVLWKVIPGQDSAGDAVKRFFGGRRPLQGSKGFMKQATLEDMSQGLDMGGEPQSYNPWTMFSMAQADIEKFVTAQRMWKEIGELGGRKFVRQGQTAPEGFTKLNDRLAKVFFPIEHYGKWIESEEIKDLRNNISETINTSKAAGEKTPADKVENTLTEALEARGWSKGEAAQIISRVKSAPATENETTTIERTIEHIISVEKTKEFKPGKGFVELGEWWVDEGAGRILNNHLSRDYVREAALGRGLLAVKNNTTAMELALSLFHFTFETVETASSQVAQAARKIYNVGILQRNVRMIGEGLKDLTAAPVSPASTARLGGSVIKYIASPEEFLATGRGQSFVKAHPEATEMVNALFHGGGKLAMHQDYKIKSLETMKENAKEGNYIGAAVRAIPALNEVLMKPLFETYIPRLKIGMFFKEYPLRLQERAQDIADGKVSKETLARETWAFVEDRLGEMNFDNLFWNRTFKSSMQLMFRSVTWKLGNIRAMGGAGPEQMKDFYQAYKDKRAPRLEPKMGWLLGMAALTAAMSSIIQKMFTGDDPQSVKDLVYPRVGKTDRVTTPTYIKDAYHLFHNPTGYVTSSLAGVWGRVADNWQNRDFYGQEVYGLDDNSFEKYAKEFFHTVPKPFSITNALAQKNSGMPTAQRALAFVGISKAPAYINYSPAENRAFEIMERHPRGTRTEEEVGRSKAAKQFLNALREKAQDPQEVISNMHEAQRGGKITSKQIAYIMKNQNTPLLVSATRAFTAQEMAEVIKKATPEEIQELKVPFLRKINNAQIEPGEKSAYRELLQ